MIVEKTRNAYNIASLGIDSKTLSSMYDSRGAPTIELCVRAHNISKTRLPKKKSKITLPYTGFL